MSGEVRRLPVRVEWQHLKRLKVSADVIGPVDLRRCPVLAIIPRTRDEHVGTSFSGAQLDDAAGVSRRSREDLRMSALIIVPHAIWAHNRPTSLPSLSGAEMRE